jgi:predicted glutamate--cysteine ligase
MQLSKGFEIELYTGTPSGQIVGLSDRISADLHGFVREPDSRNVEYTTPPRTSYDRLLCDLLRPRQALRHYLQRLGDFTLHPGSTLSLGDSSQFHRSDPANPYHDYIEQTYGTQVVTASVHINVGIDDPEALMRACRLVRVEAPLYLALSAASPFLDGKVTGYHSTRWQLFPQTPSFVPLFSSHAHFIRWTEQQLAAGTMQNVRHLWCSVRPNGERRPYCLNRLELRICDLVADPLALLAITALLEARIWQTLEAPDLDPLRQSQFSPREVVELTYQNELAAAQHSLEAELRDWQTGQPILASEWVRDLWATVRPMARAKAFHCFLSPLERILTQGNTAQQWLRQIDQGLTPQEVIEGAIAQMAAQEHDLEDKLCAGTPTLVGVG